MRRTRLVPRMAAAAAQLLVLAATLAGQVPVLNTISPAQVLAGGPPLILDADGSGFTPQSELRWNGTPLATAYVTPCRLTAYVPANLTFNTPGGSITVVNPGPGGGTSPTPRFLSVSAPQTVTTASVSPASVAAGAASFTLTVTGTGFYAGTRLAFGSLWFPTTTVLSDTQLQVTIPASGVTAPGPRAVRASNPNSSPSWEILFNVTNPSLGLAALSPASVVAGGPAFTLTATGSGFTAQSVVRWDNISLATTFVSATTLTAAVPQVIAASLWTALVKIVDPVRGESAGIQFSVGNPVPAITGLICYGAACAQIGGPGFTWQVNGTGFTTQTRITWNGQNLSTAYVNPTRVNATVPASLVAGGGQWTIRAVNPAPGGGTSSAAFYSLDNPVPVLASLSPMSVAAGSCAPTLVLTGTGFNASSRVRWDMQEIPTTFVSATMLNARAPDWQMAAGGAHTVDVRNPPPMGGTSATLTFNVMNPGPVIASIAPSSATAGDPGFTLTVTGSGFNSQSAVLWNGTALYTVLVSATTVTASVDPGRLVIPGTALVSVQNPPPGGGTTIALPFTIVPVPVVPDQNAVAFAVDGPMNPHTEGIGYPRGGPASGGYPGDPVAAAIRTGPVAVAAAIPTPMPGDIADFGAAGVPSEAVLFQSPYFPAPALAALPNGMNNQVLQPMAMGLAAGAPVAPPLFTAIGPMRDRVDGISFGEDYFPPVMMLGPDPDPAVAFLPPPGMPVAIPWAARGVPFHEQVVTDAGPVSLRFSIDPWAIGAAGSAARTLSGGLDEGTGDGPWTSDGAAAGDVLGTPLLARVAGVTAGAAGNTLVHAHAALGLLPVAGSSTPAEADVKALECAGDNTVPWVAGIPMIAGNLHARVAENFSAPEPPGPLASIHDATSAAPVFFTVGRSSPGLPGTAVRSQFVIDGGAAADIYVAVTLPGGAVINLLFIDNDELGLMWTDDIDGLMIWVDPMVRPMITAAIDTMIAMGMAGGWMPYTGPGGAATGAFTGPGMMLSVTKYLGAAVAGGIRVAFSVTTDSIGLANTAVDYEAEPYFPPAPFSSAAGDVFYVPISGGAVNSNWLWFRETDLGLDGGAWVNGVSTDLGELADNLDGLDSAPFAPACGGAAPAYGAGCPGSGGIVPMLAVNGCPSPGRSISLTVTEGLGGAPFFLLVGPAPASIPFAGGCTLLLDPASLTAVPFTLAGAGPGNGMFTLSLRFPPGTPPATLNAQAVIADATAASGYCATNGVAMTIAP